MSRRLACGGVLVAALCPAADGVSTQMTVSLADVLGYYELGEHELVARALRTSMAGDPDRVIPLLAREAEAWIDAGSASERPRRRLAAATFALELGLAGVDTQWEVTKQATEWACAMLRRAGPPTAAEREWQLAALALLEGSYEPPSLQRPESLALPAHVRHVQQRFPDEPRLALARALGAEHDFWRLHIRAERSGIVRHDDRLADDAMRALDAAAAHPATRAEARLRLGVLEQHRGRAEAAFPHLAAAAEGDDDPTRVYLAHLVSGWAHDQAGRYDEAIASYRRALAAVNGLSAALGLAVRLYAQDARDEGDAVVTAALEAGLDDPWKQYGYGDFRRLPLLIARLRAAVAR